MAPDANSAGAAPAVSVIVPLFNKAREVRRALDSVVGQTFSDWEIVVVDDYSEDGGGELVQSLAIPKLRLFRKANEGVSIARNFAVSEARGALVAFLDADDEWLPDHLETIVRLARAHPECGAIATGYSRVLAGGRPQTPALLHIPPAPWEGILPDYFRAALGPHPLWTSAVAVRRDLFLELGGFPSDRRRGEDLHLWFRLALKTRIAFCSTPSAIYHTEAGNRSNEGNLSAGRDGAAPASQIVGIPTANLPSWVKRADVEEYLNKVHIMSAVSLVWQGKPAAARARLAQAASTRRLRRWRMKWLLLSHIPLPLLQRLRRD